MHDTPVTLNRGHVAGRYSLPPDLHRVRAGLPTWPIYGEHYPPRGDSDFYLFVMEYDDLSEIGYFAGDTILIDHSMLGYWRTERYDGRIVMVATHFGKLIGRFDYDPMQHAHTIVFLDGKETTILWTPEMEIKGVAHFGWKDLSFGTDGNPIFR